MAEIPVDQQNELLFMQTVMMFQGMAMQNLGKVMNPVTNQVDRNLDQAKNMIDLLGMLEAKTTGNLNDNEKNLLTHALYELRMNYVDEIKKADASAQEGDAPDQESEPEAQEQSADAPDAPAEESASEDKA